MDNIIAQNKFFATENQTESQTENQIKVLQTLFKPRPKKKIKRIQNKKEVIGSKVYRQDEAIILIEMDHNGKVVDIRPVKTIETLKEFLEKSNKNFMYTPNPVKIPEDYWIRYKQARSSIERVRLATEFELLMDKSILNITYIVLDIDSPFEEVYPVWQKLVKKLGLTGYVVFKTKSGRFRAYIKVVGKFNDGKKTFKLTINGKAKNRRKHIINAYEIQYILAAFFEKKGLKYDHSFVGRLNHPVWIEEREVFDEGKSQLYEIKEGEIPFYTLYNRVKKLQREEELWTYKGENIRELLKKKEEQITQQTTGTQQTKQQTTQKTTQQTTQQTQQTNKQRQRKITKSKLKKTDLEKLEEAIEVLKEEHKTHRFTKIMLPVVGWAKYLGLEKDTVYDLLRKHLITKSNFDEDFEKAWKYGDPLQFSYGEDLLVRIEKYLNEFVNVSEKFRLELLELFSSEADYYDTERYLLRRGYIEEEFRKTGGRGRPRKVIKITQKGIDLIQQWKAGGELEELLSNTDNNVDNNTDNTDPSLEKDFTLNNYFFPLGKQSLDGLVGNGWKENLYTTSNNQSLFTPYKPPTPSNYLSVELSTTLRKYLPPLPTSKIYRLKNLSEYNFDKTTPDDSTSDDQATTPKSLSTVDNLSETTLDKQSKRHSTKQTMKDNKAKKSTSKNKQKSKSEEPKKNLSGGGFTREARIMALLLGYDRDQMARAVVNISNCISYFYQKNQNNFDDAIYRTFAVYLYLSEKAAGKKVFLNIESVRRFEEESLQSEISKVAWGYLLRYQEKYKLKQEQKQKEQREKWRKKQKVFEGFEQ